MSRSKWKGPFLAKYLLTCVSKTPKVWSRSSVIPDSLVGKTALVYNGKSFLRVGIKRDRVGFKFGEFAFTRNNGFIKKKKKLRKSK